MSSSLNKINRPKLAVGFILTGCAALSVHAYMMQGLGVPYPDHSLITVPLKFLVRAVSTLGLLVLWQLAAPCVRGTFVKQWAVLLLIGTMLTESLIRGPFMEGYCTTVWVFAIVGNVPKLVTAAATSALIVLAMPRLIRAWHKVVAAVVIAAIAMFAIAPLIGAAMGPVMGSIAHLAPTSEWCELPYGANVLIPAYLTFVEPTLACFAMVALIWWRLAPSLSVKLAQLTLLVLAIKNQLLLPVIYALVAKTPLLDAVVSEGQFTLEAIALAVLAGLSWEWSRLKAGHAS